MRDRLTEILKQTYFDYCEECAACFEDGYKTPPSLEEFFADYLLENGVIALPCKIGQTVYEIEPLWYGIWYENEHKCRKCEHFYEGGMGDEPDCGLGKKCCYHIVEKEADVRSLADWIIPKTFTKEVAWGKTVFLTKREAEQALAEVTNGTK